MIIPKIVISLAMVVLLSAAVAIYFDQETQIKRIQEKNSELEVLVENARKERDEKEALLEKSDSLEYIEKIAREELGMIKPGETVFID